MNLLTRGVGGGERIAEGVVVGSIVGSIVCRIVCRVECDVISTISGFGVLSLVSGFSAVLTA